MPQASSSAKLTKSTKASKAAQAILHPIATIAAAKANHSRQSSTESTPTSESAAAKPTKSPAASIRTMPSNASIASQSEKPLPSAPTSRSPAGSTANLPTSAPAPSVLAPAINGDILSMKKGALGGTKPAHQQAPALSPAAQAAITKPALAPSSAAAPSSTPAAAAPYAIDDTAALAGKVTQAKATTPPQAEKASVLEPAAAAAKSSTEIQASLTTNAATFNAAEPRDTKDTPSFAAEVAEVLASTAPEPDQTPVAAAVAALTPVTAAIAEKSAEALPKVEATSTSAAELSLTSSATTTPISAENGTTATPTSTAISKTSVFTPPELTKLQHNTFVSRPTDPSRAAIRHLDHSFLRTPLRPLQSGLKRRPTHVVIFGWMDAPIRLVAKYAQPYTVLFPDATVLIQLSDGKSYLARENVRREQLQRVISEITTPALTEQKSVKPVETKEIGDSTVTLIDHSEACSTSSLSEHESTQEPEVGGFVIHSFSDGGAGNLALFLDEMARRPTPSPRVHSLIMDSSPGKSNPKTGSVAFTMHLANRPKVRAIVQFLVYIGLYLMKIWTKITGQPARGELMRKRLNSLRSWAWVTGSYTPKLPSQSVEKKEATAEDYPPRMYMYTKADKLIPWQFVEEHAQHLAEIRGLKEPSLVEVEKVADRENLLDSVNGNNKAQGEKEYKVELRRWDTPPHCSIGRSDFEGYWAAVMDFYLKVLRRE